MIIKSADFVTSAVKPSQYPETGLMEIAFAGRSNVGKSSLVNVLVNRKRLVKTSSTPGRTQLLNFFTVNTANGEYSFVDLPGYGYAKVPAAVQKEWGPMIETYLSMRANLRAVVLIMDIRREPRKDETDFMAWLKRFDIPAVLVLTKVDKFSAMQQQKRWTEVAEALAVEKDNLILFSAKTRKGREKVWETIEQTVRLYGNRIDKTI